MIIVSIKSAAGGETNRIELSDGSFFSFKNCYLPPDFTGSSPCTPALAEGREISADEETGLRFASACLRAEKSALHLIARAEQCIFGLGRKLVRRGHEPACVNAVLSRLAQLDLVDDRRFAELWLESRLAAAKSPVRLLSSLRSRGIDRQTAEAALKAVLDNDTEWTLLVRFTEKLKFKENAGTRSLKFLLKSEGFSSEVIERLFEE